MGLPLPAPTKSIVPRGVYAPSTSTDLRSPCPLINCLANHGLISRDGRHIRPDELQSALKEVGISRALGSFLGDPIFLERQDAISTADRMRAPLSYIWYLLCNPWALVAASNGMREPGQTDGMGRKYVNLDQFAQHGVLEHDVSLTRDDLFQGDNRSAQPALVQNLLDSSTDGGKSITLDNLADLRKRRIQERKMWNPQLTYGFREHQGGCAEIALFMHVFGNGSKVPREYASAVFKEERLPYKEGWSRRRFWTLGYVELTIAVIQLLLLIGVSAY